MLPVLDSCHTLASRSSSRLARMGAERQTVATLATLLPDTAISGGLDTCPSILRTICFGLGRARYRDRHRYSQRRLCMHGVSLTSMGRWSLLLAKSSCTIFAFKVPVVRRTTAHLCCQDSVADCSLTLCLMSSHRPIWPINLRLCQSNLSIAR